MSNVIERAPDAQGIGTEPVPRETVETYVSRVMDTAPLTRTHYKIFGLIASGYFFDIANMAVLGSLVPMMLQTNFMTQDQVAVVGSATLFGLAVGCAGQGEFTDRFGRKAVYQFNLLLFGLATLASVFAPNYLCLAALRFMAGIGLGAEQPLCFAYAGEYAPKRNRGRILSCIHLIGGAFSWPITTLFTLFFINIIGWRGVFAALAIGALIVFILRFSLPESPRWLAIRGRGGEALSILKRMGIVGEHPERFLAPEDHVKAPRDPLMIVFRNYPFRLLAGTVCFIAFFGGAVGLSTWLPNMMASQHGMSVTKSLTYSIGMMMAVPCASSFMMFAIEKFGRKRLAITSFFLAGIFAYFFMRTTTDTQLLSVGFCMVFFIQLAGNSMQILISEVFPTSARATGFGIASGAGRLGTAFIIPAILWIQNGWGVNAVFAAIAGSLMLAAICVPLLGPEARGRGLDELASSK